MAAPLDGVLREPRATRASPPAQAGVDHHRRAIYNAALEQFEELLEAARVVGPASRPLPLFYALSQASRAIVAAGSDVPSVTSHGLVEYRYRGEERPPSEFLHRRIERRPNKDRRDAFGALARTSGSGSSRAACSWARFGQRSRTPTVYLKAHGYPRGDARSTSRSTPRPLRTARTFMCC
jgi:hypothetical protein